MAKASIDTGQASQPVHTRTTSDSVESQAVVLGIDGSDSVVPASTVGLSVVVVAEPKATVVARSQVADTTVEGQLLASNVNRLGATLMNDSSAVLYVGLGTSTVSSTDHTLRLGRFEYYEVPANFTGAIRGVWASDPNDGGARVTELTA